MDIPKEEKPFLALFENFYADGEVTWIGVRPKSRAKIIELNAVDVEENGLAGDRSNKPINSGKRQVTLIQAEHIKAVAAFMNVAEVSPALLRRNIVVKGINLNALKGKQIQIGNAILEMTGYCYPCSRMEENLGNGGFNAMRGHGGITCKVIKEGKITIGDKVKA